MTRPGLPRFGRVFNIRREGLRCELCRAALTALHRHLINVEDYRLLCACGNCVAALLKSARESFRVVPQVVHKCTGWTPARADWDRLQLPGIAFFLRPSRLGHWLSIFPSTVGALDGDLPESGLHDLLGTFPEPTRVALDVEALLVDGLHTDCFQAYIVPLDVCFDLVALVRQVWTGLGGEGARHELQQFFVALDRRAVELRLVQRVRPEPTPGVRTCAG